MESESLVKTVKTLWLSTCFFQFLFVRYLVVCVQILDNPILSSSPHMFSPDFRLVMSDIMTCLAQYAAGD